MKVTCTIDEGVMANATWHGFASAHPIARAVNSALGRRWGVFCYDGRLEIWARFALSRSSSWCQAEQNRTKYMAWSGPAPALPDADALPVEFAIDLPEYITDWPED